MSNHRTSDVILALVTAGFVATGGAGFLAGSVDLALGGDWKLMVGSGGVFLTGLAIGRIWVRREAK